MIDFKKCYMDLYNSKILSDNANNLDNIKNIFDESLKCFSIQAYRGAIVMAMTGFDMIIRDRLLKYQKSIDTLTTVNIKWSNYNLTDDNKWDTNLHQLIVNSDNNFNSIFPDKSTWQLNWKNWIDKRHISAHGKPYSIYSYDVESFYSWIKQAFYALYPIGTIEYILQEIEIFFDISITPPNKDNKYLIDTIKNIHSKDDYNKILDQVCKIYIKYNNSKEGVINNKILVFIIELFKTDTINAKKLTDFIEISIEKIINKNNQNDIEKNNLTTFITYIFVADINILDKIRTNYNESLYKYLHNVNFDIWYLNVFYPCLQSDSDFIELLKDKLSKLDLNSIAYDSFKNINKFIVEEIEYRITNLSESDSFEKANTKMKRIPTHLLNNKHMENILKSYKKNSQVNGSWRVESFIKEMLKNKEKYLNVDFSILEEKKDDNSDIESPF